MNKLASMVLGLALIWMPHAALAQAIDGKSLLVCSTVETFDCEPGSRCIRGLAEAIDAPQFFFLDFDKGMARTVRAGGEERTSEITGTQEGGGQLILQGSQAGHAWSATIGQESGALVLAVAGEGVAFVVFGACTPM